MAAVSRHGTGTAIVRFSDSEGSDLVVVYMAATKPTLRKIQEQGSPAAASAGAGDTSEAAMAPPAPPPQYKIDHKNYEGKVFSSVEQVLEHLRERGRITQTLPAPSDGNAGRAASADR